MKMYKKDDGLKTRLQWLSEGYKVKKDADGLELVTSYTYKKTAIFYSRKEVRKSTAAIREYKERERKRRKEAERIRKAKYPNLPIPADALQPCELPDYAGWSASYKPSGKAVMIVDTETTGLDDDWNSMLQLSWQVVDTATWEVLSQHNYYFRHPANWERVTMKAIEVNGLTEERLETLGTSPLKVALSAFKADYKGCDLIVGHNLEFDLGFIFTAFGTMEEKTKDELYDIEWPDDDKQYCTMLCTTELCQLPGYYDDGYKWPRLSELAAHLKIDYRDLNLHDSSADVELTKRCFRKLVETKFVHIE